MLLANVEELLIDKIDDFTYGLFIVQIVNVPDPYWIPLWYNLIIIEFELVYVGFMYKREKFTVTYDDDIVRKEEFINVL